MNVRRLSGKDDFNKFLEISLIHKKIGGTLPLNGEQLIEYYEKYFLNSTDNFSKFQALGYEEEGELISVICVGYIENLSRGRYWAIPLFFSRKKHNLFSFNKPEIGLLIKTAFENAEKNEYYEYYYCIAEHIADVYEVQIDKNKFIPLKRYERLTLEIIPKNTHSSVDLYARLLGGPKPHNMVIKKRILKEEFRKPKK